MSIRVTLEIGRERTRVMVDVPNAFWRWLLSLLAAAYVLLVGRDGH